MLRRTREFLDKNTTFYHLHLLYFISLACAGSIILWSFTSISVIDSVYTIVSGLCLGGLSAVPIEDIPLGGQVLIFFTMILGGQIIGSVVPLLIRRHRYIKVATSAIKRPSSNKYTLVRRLLTLRSNDDLWMNSIASRDHLPEAFRVIFLQHQAICELINIVVCYVLVVHLVGFVVAVACLRFDSDSREVLLRKGVNPGFFAIFAVVSAFSNTGFVLSSENMVPLNTSTLLLFDLTLVIWLGNTLFPVALRLIISIIHHRSSGTRKEVYSLLLDHPRKYYPHLFPRTATRWLVLTVVGMNGISSIIFYVLDWENRSIRSLTPLQKLVNGVFQGANARNGGMNSMNLEDLSPALLFLYCIMMYVRAYPVDLNDEQNPEPDTTICSQARRKITRDSTYLTLLILFICISLNTEMKHDPRNFNIFNIVFEVVSAYGCVGLTIGYTCDLRLEKRSSCRDTPVSFSGVWSVPAKIFIIVVMLLGRHRGLPDRVESVEASEKALLLLKRPQSLLQLVTV